MIITITEGEDYSSEAIDIYKKIGTVHVFNKTMPIDWSLVHQSDVLVIRLQYKLDEQMLQKCNHLKYIITPTTGLNHIDLNKAISRGINVLSLKGETTFLNQIPSTAEHTWALLMACQRKLIAAVTHTKNGHWDRDQFKGYNLKGKIIGIIGLGRVGKQVARFATCFEMNVIYFDPYLKEEVKEGTRYEDMNALFSLADIITIHVPLGKSTEKLIQSEQLMLMKSNAIIINTSRGEIWDEEAVAAALIRQKIAGVATDVLANEFEQDAIKTNVLIQLQKQGYPVLITPHIAGATYDSMQQTEVFMAQKFKQHLKQNVRN